MHGTLRDDFDTAGLDPITGLDGHKLRKESAREANLAESELRAFYRKSKFLLAEFTLDYLQQFKPLGQRRKDKVTESILHELRPAQLIKALVESKKLPRSVTYRLEHRPPNPQSLKIPLPKELQSIERLFCAIHVHDLDEDFADASLEGLRGYLYTRIDEIQNISESQKARLRKEADMDVRSMETLTFGRKVWDPKTGNEETKRISTHGNDHQLYLDALQNHWPGIAAKAPDRDDGLRTRYGFKADIFTVEQDAAYLEETRRLFMYRRSLEESMKIYPELAPYFDIMNNRLDIALRCFGVMTAHHPSTLKTHPDPTINPETARIDIKDFLEKATKGTEHMNGGVDPFLARMLWGFEQEAKRYPVLSNIVVQIRDQLTPYITPTVDAAPTPGYSAPAAAAE